MNRFIHTTMRPAMYHGHEQAPPFFEGWYYKLVSADESQRFAVIPGVFLGENGHAFVQVLDGSSGRSAYHVYPLDDFWASEEDFDLRIGPNRFCTEAISLDIDRPEGQVRGQLRFQGIKPWPVSWRSPGIMGWYAWMPRMECYHGVLSLDHEIAGLLEVDGRQIDFSGGRGYIEKDWGQAFPEGYVWFQTNHFASPGTSITASVAIIPWMRNAFTGFIIGVLHRGLLYRFATYTGARIERLDIGDDQVNWAVSSRNYRLEMRACRAEGGLLQAPSTVDMGRRVTETIKATVDLRLSTVDGRLLLEDQGRHAGLEVFGNLRRLQALR